MIRTTITLVLLASAVLPAASAPQDRDRLAKAGPLFAEARKLITGNEVAGLQYLDLAQTELESDPAGAVEDATRAFQIALALEARRPASGDPPKTAADMKLAARAYAEPPTSPQRPILIDHALDALVVDSTERGRAIGAMSVGYARACGLLSAEHEKKATKIPLPVFPEPPAGTKTVCVWDTPPRSLYPERKRLSDPSVLKLTDAELDERIRAARATADPERRFYALLAIAGGLTGSAR